MTIHATRWARAGATAVAAVLLGLGGCATPGRHLSEVADAVVEERPTAPTRPEPPAAVREALVPPLEPPDAGPHAAERATRFDVAVNEVDARSFFLQLVEGTPYDMVVHPAVEGRLTLTLRGVTIAEILDVVRDVYGFGFRETPTGFTVLPAALQSRLFQLDYLHVGRRGRSQVRVSSGQLTEQFTGGTSQTSLGLGPTTTGSQPISVIESTQVKTESEMDFWAELEASLEAIVGEGEGREVVTSPQAGIVVVRAMPEELREVAEFLSGTQTNVQRQVVLEAKILEVELEDGYRTGINWSTLIEWGTKSILLGQTGGGTFFDEGVSEIVGNTGDLNPGAATPPNGTETSAFGGVFSAALDLDDFQAFIELLETQGEVHLLSSPVVSTLNNQKAVIKVGQDEFFVTDVSTTTVTGTVATTSPDVTLTPFFSGIALDVLPQISGEGDVTLHVHPSISNAQDQTKTISLGDDDLTLPLALTTIRETDTVVRARSGQIVVIGGLIQDSSARRSASIPWLGRIKGLGWLFGQRQGDTRRSELVILLRPRVLGADGWSEELRRVERRLEHGQYGAEARRLLSNDGWGFAP